MYFDDWHLVLYEIHYVSVIRRAAQQKSLTESYKISRP